MEQHALELAIAKANRYGYDESYIPELYAEYMQVLTLQGRVKQIESAEPKPAFAKTKKHNDIIE